MAKGGYKGSSPARETSPEEYSGVWNIVEQYDEQKAGSWPLQADDCAPKSLRFNSADQTSLETTIPNITTFSFSFWYKHVSLTRNDIFVTDASYGFFFYQHTDGRFKLNNNNNILFESNGYYRDPSAFYHCLLTNDGVTLKFYVNGVLDKAQTVGTFLNAGGLYIGRDRASASNYGNFLLAELNFIDGQALLPIDFGFYDGQGIWQPKRFTGTYATGTVWSNYLTATNGGFHAAPYNEPAGFNGFVGSTSGGYVQTANGTANPNSLTFTPPTGIPYKDKVEVWLINNANTVSVNGGTAQSIAGTQWVQVATGPGTLTSIKFERPSTNGASFGGIRIDGMDLTDPVVGANSFHLDFSDGVKDQSGLGNDWTANNVSIFSGSAVSRIWESTSTYTPSGGSPTDHWTIASGGGSATKATSGQYGDLFSQVLEPGKIYAFTTAWPSGDDNGGWWFGDSNANGLSGTHPNQGRGSNSIGQRGRSANPANDTIGAWGTFLAPNGLASNAGSSSNLSGYQNINPYGTTSIDWVVDRTTNKVWAKPSSNSTWVKGGNPSNASSTPTFHLPATGNLYFGFVQHSSMSSPGATITSFSFNPTDRADDILVDSPVNGKEASTGAGGERRGNYCCFNPLDKHSSLTISDGNLKVQASTTQWQLARSTFFLNSGKHYWEFTWTGSVTGSSGYQMGLKTPGSTLSAAAEQAGSYAFQYTSIYQTAGSTNTVVISPGSTTSGDTVMFAYDADAGKMWIGVNGTWNGSGNPATGANPDWTNLPKTGLSPFAGCYGNGNTITLNAGQRAFKYTNHSGFSPLATSFLPEPTIKRGDEAMDVTLWQGTASNLKVDNLRLSPDLVWAKNRLNSTGYHHGLFDIVRGANKVIKSSDAGSETTYTQQLTSFDENGFTLGNNSDGGNYVNLSGDQYVGWVWDAGDTTTTIAAGSLNSSSFDQSQQWSAGMKTSVAQTTSYITTGRTTSFPSSFTGQEPFNADLTDFLYGQTGIAGTWIYLEFATALTNVTSISFSTEYSCPNGLIKLNGTDVAVDQSDLAGGFVEVNVTGTIPSSLTEIAIQGVGGSSRLKWIKIDGKYLIDGNPGVGKTLTRFRAKTDWNWHRIAAVKVNGAILTAGTLDNTGSVWTSVNEWKDGNADSSNATYSQSARGDWFDVTLDSNIANFSELQFYMQLDSAAGSTTNIYEIELFFSDGTSFLKTYASNSDAPNQANYQFNSWQWQNFGDLGVAINLPSNPSTVRARPEVGFSIVKYDGDNALGTSFAHGLNKKPDMIVVKNLDSGDNWAVYHSALGATKFLDLNRPDSANSNTGWWYGTEPTSSVFYTGNASTTAGNTQEHIAYAFSEIEGYSKFTSFTGTNGDVFVYLGFRPRLIWFKNADATTNWLCYDTARNPSNPANFSVQLDEANTDTTVTNDEIDILSNGFNVKATRSDLTGNGNQIIVAAWAEHPFASQARAR